MQPSAKAIYSLFLCPIEKNRIDIATNVIDKGNALAVNASAI